MLFSHKNNMFGFPAEGVRRKREKSSEITQKKGENFLIKKNKQNRNK